MTYDYDKLYGATPEALGPPTAVFVDFFDRYPRRDARVLDVGCGQGRDALFVARREHRVLGVDLSANGIRDLVAAARREGLPIEGVVADITAFTPPGIFDIVLIDRTLHMLDRAARRVVLTRLLGHLAEEGWLLIADEPSNMGDFKSVLAADQRDWTLTRETRGILFARPAAPDTRQHPR